MISVNTPLPSFILIPDPEGGFKKQATREITYQGPNPKGQPTDSVNARGFDMAYLEGAEIEVKGEGLNAYYDDTDATIKVEAENEQASGTVLVTALGT